MAETRRPVCWAAATSKASANVARRASRALVLGGDVVRSPPAADLGPVGVGAGQADLAVPERRQVDRDLARHADERHGAPGADHGQRLLDRLGAAHAVEHHVGPARQGGGRPRPPPKESEWLWRRTARASWSGGRASVAPNSRGQALLVGVAGADQQRPGAGQRPVAARWVRAAVTVRPERARAEHGDHVAVRDARAETACTAQATGSTVTASASLSPSGTAKSWLAWATRPGVDQPPPVSAQKPVCSPGRM